MRLSQYRMNLQKKKYKCLFFLVSLYYQDLNMLTLQLNQLNPFVELCLIRLNHFFPLGIMNLNLQRLLSDMEFCTTDALDILDTTIKL